MNKRDICIRCFFLLHYKEKTENPEYVLRRNIFAQLINRLKIQTFSDVTPFRFINCYGRFENPSVFVFTVKQSKTYRNSGMHKLSKKKKKLEKPPQNSRLQYDVKQERRKGHQ